MAHPDYYKILGVPRSASPEDIKKAYKKLARKHHPDLNQGDAASESRFKDISVANEVLSDPEKRRNYDQHGDPAGPQSQPMPEGFSGFDIGDLFGSFMGGQGSPRRRGPERGEDLQRLVRISFQDAFKGTRLSFNVHRTETCLTCHGNGEGPGEKTTCRACNGKGQVERGSGFFRQKEPCEACGGAGKKGPACPTCQGRGRNPKQDTITVNIPQGIEEGQKLRLAAKGEAGRRGGGPGDLFLQIEVEKDPRFERRGANLYLTLPVSYTEAALGAKVDVPTPEGSSTIKVPPGTQSGAKLRLKEKGMPLPKSTHRGDLFAEVKVVTPTVQDERSKELLRELGELNDQHLRDQAWGQP
ncbi:MAG: J domain-containing protein [Holophagaceae bacterium]|nr:J domain-containing protein [Holophagaceae bacterium]